jgi:glycerol-3-phosphate dehydrogenase
VEQDGDYGKILCRCEVVTRKEVLDALTNPLGVLTLVGIKLRSRAMMGRCQGGFCSPRIVDMLVKEMGTPVSEVSLRGTGSWMFTGTAKGSSQNEN